MSWKIETESFGLLKWYIIVHVNSSYAPERRKKMTTYELVNLERHPVWRENDAEKSSRYGNRKAKMLTEVLEMKVSQKFLMIKGQKGLCMFTKSSRKYRIIMNMCLISLDTTIMNEALQIKSSLFRRVERRNKETPHYDYN